MARFTIVVRSPRPARAVFARLVDWDAHSAAIPFTRLEHDGEPRVGQRIVARTALGFGLDRLDRRGVTRLGRRQVDGRGVAGLDRRGVAQLDRRGVGALGFDDPMEVRVLRAPAGDAPGDEGGRVEVVKLGRVIAGWVRWTVTATAAGGVSAGWAASGARRVPRPAGTPEPHLAPPPPAGLPPGCVVEWTQELTVPWLPSWADPLVGRVGRVAYRAGLRRMLRSP